jgi:hypothetical protein
MADQIAAAAVVVAVVVAPGVVAGVVAVAGVVVAGVVVVVVVAVAGVVAGIVVADIVVVVADVVERNIQVVVVVVAEEACIRRVVVVPDHTPIEAVGRDTANTYLVVVAAVVVVEVWLGPVGVVLVVEKVVRWDGSWCWTKTKTRKHLPPTRWLSWLWKLS